MNAVLDTRQQPHLVDPLEGSGKRSRCSGRQTVMRSRGDLQYSSLRDFMRADAYAEDNLPV